MKKMWCIPPKQNAEFVAHMEDIISVYERPYSESHPVVCMDEKPFQLLDNQYEIIPMGRDNHTEKFDCEYERTGTGSIFLFTEPLSGWRCAFAESHRRGVDWAYKVKWLLNGPYQHAEKVVLTMDNLNTHSVASLYKAFPPAEAFELANRLEIHYTPKHGSWLNIAEIELSALSIQCLGSRRIPSIEVLNTELSAWHMRRNAAQKGVDWQFTNDQARIKLKHLYPIIES
jgi:hypothetical protein